LETLGGYRSGLTGSTNSLYRSPFTVHKHGGRDVAKMERGWTRFAVFGVPLRNLPSPICTSQHPHLPVGRHGKSPTPTNHHSQGDHSDLSPEANHKARQQRTCKIQRKDAEVYRNFVSKGSRAEKRRRYLVASLRRFPHPPVAKLAGKQQHPILPRRHATVIEGEEEAPTDGGLRHLEEEEGRLG
jgi:hypothetical protein